MPLSVGVSNVTIAPQQATVGTQATAGGRAVEVRIGGTTPAGCGLIAPTGELSQVAAISLATLGGARVEVRVADGTSQEAMMTALRTLATWIRANNPATDNENAQTALQGLRTIMQRIRMDNLRAP